MHAVKLAKVGAGPGHDRATGGAQADLRLLGSTKKVVHLFN